jgi:hypothetical protein
MNTGPQVTSFAIGGSSDFDKDHSSALLTGNGCYDGEELRLLPPKFNILHVKVSPQNKIRIVKALSGGRRGAWYDCDGVTMLPHLAIWVAMGKEEPMSLEAAEMILADGNLPPSLVPSVKVVLSGTIFGAYSSTPYQQRPGKECALDLSGLDETPLSSLDSGALL